MLSHSTEEYDCGEKLEHYKEIPSLIEVMLVAHDRRTVEVWQRQADRWVVREVDAHGTIELQSLGCKLSVDEIYRNPLS